MMAQQPKKSRREIQLEAALKLALKGLERHQSEWLGGNKRIDKVRGVLGLPPIEVKAVHAMRRGGQSTVCSLNEGKWPPKPWPKGHFKALEGDPGVTCLECNAIIEDEIQSRRWNRS